MKIVLASESEWRKNLLAWLELPFEVVGSGVEETVYADEEASEVVARLATEKAEATAKKLSEEVGIVIGADTVIEIDGKIIGKPDNRQDARKIMQQLAGKTHEVWTGVCAVDDVGNRRVEVEKTIVKFKPMTQAQIEKYLDQNEWVGKAGGYQVQGAIKPYVADIQGSYTNVIGLPLLMVQDMLESLGVGVEVDLPGLIKTKTGYTS